MMNFQYKNGCKGQIYDGSISKNYVTKSTPYMESFIIVSKIAQLSRTMLLYYIIIPLAPGKT